MSENIKFLRILPSESVTFTIRAIKKGQIQLKSFAFIIAIITLIVGFSACERMSQIIQPATPQIEDESSEISIGVVLPLTGHLASTGERMKHGLDLALNEINNAQSSNTKFKFIIANDTSTPESAVAAFNKLIHQDVCLLFSVLRLKCDPSGFPDRTRKPDCGN